MRATPKEEKAIAECYRRLFKASTPPADFDLLVENAIIDENGLKHIPFEDHIIDFDVSMEIINEIIKEYKIDKDYEHPFKVTIYQGCSPKYNKKY